MLNTISKFIIKSECSNESKVSFDDVSVGFTGEIVVLGLELFPVVTVDVLVSVEESSKTFLGEWLNDLFVKHSLSL